MATTSHFIYNGAFIGAMGGPEVWIQSRQGPSYDAQVNAASAFANAVIAIADDPPSGFEAPSARLMQSVCQAAFANRPDLINATSFDDIAAACVASYNEAAVDLEDEPSTGGAIVPLPNVRYVDADSVTGTEDGSIANPYLTVQAAFDDLFNTGADKSTILVTPSTGNPGGLTVPNGFGESLSLVGVNSGQLSIETDFESTGFAAGAHMGAITCDEGGSNQRITAENIVIDSIAALGSESPSDVRFMLVGAQCPTINIPSGRLYSFGSTIRAVTSVDMFLQTTAVNHFGSPILTASQVTTDQASYNAIVSAAANVTGVDTFVIEDADKPLSNVFAVDPSNATAVTPNGFPSNVLAYPTVQAAFDAAIQVTSRFTIQCAPNTTTAGPLVVPLGSALEDLVIKGLGDPAVSESAFLDSMTLNNAAANISLIGMRVLGNVNGSSVPMAGAFVLRNTAIDGNVTGHGLIVEMRDGSSIDGALDVGDVTAFDKSVLPADLTTFSALIRWDSLTETTYFAAAPDPPLANGFQCSALDGVVPLGTIAANSAQTFNANDARLIIPSAKLTAARIYKLANTLGLASGAVVDVWSQTFNVTIHDSADATLITIAAGSDPVRLFFFSSGADAVYVLTGKQSLLLV